MLIVLLVLLLVVGRCLTAAAWLSISLLLLLVFRVRDGAHEEVTPGGDAGDESDDSRCVVSNPTDAAEESRSSSTRLGMLTLCLLLLLLFSSSGRGESP